MLSISKDDKKETVTHKKEAMHVHEDIQVEAKEKKIGTDVGDTCPICKLGTVEDLGGCHSCSNCGAQVKCGI